MTDEWKTSECRCHFYRKSEPQKKGRFFGLCHSECNKRRRDKAFWRIIIKKKNSSRHSRKRKLISFLVCEFFFYIIRIIEVHNFRTNKRISLIKELIQDISKVGPLSKFHSIRFSISEVRVFTIFPLYIDIYINKVIAMGLFLKKST